MKQTKKTKIIGTIGPASESKEQLIRLVEAGLNVARLNFSHGTHEDHKLRIKTIREVEKELGVPIAILQDLQGPKIRLGKMLSPRTLSEGEEVVLAHGKEQTDEAILPVQYPVFSHLEKGHRIFINDGLVELKVLSATKDKAVCKVITTGPISTHKGLNLPDTFLPYASFTDKDKEDLAFGLKEKVDYVAISFVQTVDDIQKVRKAIKSHTHQPKIIVKLETIPAIKNLEPIVEAVDGVMVARGDLAIEIGQEEVPIVQRKIIQVARAHAKPVIVATQMLESMVTNVQPTRAEVSDVATAVLDEVDAVMLSAECATGAHPVEAVKVMSRIARRVEAFRMQSATDFTLVHVDDDMQQTTAVAAAANLLAHQMKADAMFSLTETGKTAIRISAYRPKQMILVVSDNLLVTRQLSLEYGIVPFYVKKIHNNEEILMEVLTRIEKDGYLKEGDTLVVVSGSQPGVAGKTDTIRIVHL
jgi:pyruvate kinase